MGRHTMRAPSWATVLLLAASIVPTGCPAPEEGRVDQTTDPELAEVALDVLSDLGEAGAYKAEGRLPEALLAWQNAHRTFRTTIAAPFRTVDPIKTLQLEYAFGRHRNALRTRRGHPDDVLEEMEADFASVLEQREVFSTGVQPVETP